MCSSIQLQETVVFTNNKSLDQQASAVSLGNAGNFVPNYIFRGSYTSAHVLLNLLNKLGKSDKMEACRAFYHFFATSLKYSIIQGHECSILFII